MAIQGDNGLLTSMWADKHKLTLAHYREASIYLHKYFSGLTEPVTAGTDEAKALLTYIRPAGYKEVSVGPTLIDSKNHQEDSLTVDDSHSHTYKQSHKSHNLH